MTAHDRTEFAKAMQGIARNHGLWEVWSDWLLMSAHAIANSVDKRPDVWQKREDAYMNVVKRYRKEQVGGMADLLGMLTLELDKDPCDFLGRTFMALELGNKWAGQFFTPDSLSYMMAEMLHTDSLAQHIKDHGFVTVSEPACGGGATIIGLCKSMLNRGINYQQTMHVTCVDVDIRSVHMAYIQLSLLHVPAVIIHGNTLTLEEWSHWYTPAHILGGWSRKLRQQNEQAQQPVVIQSPPKLFTKDDQIALFGE